MSAKFTIRGRENLKETVKQLSLEDNKHEGSAKYGNKAVYKYKY